MKLSKEALLEIMVVVQDAILESKDASDGLRELDFVLKLGGEENRVAELALSEEYTTAHPRSGTWLEEPDEETN